MRKKNSIASFTIIELVMALLISSVVITIVYYVYLLFNNQFAGYQLKGAAMDEYFMLQKALQRDMEQADAVEAPSEHEIVCKTTVNGQTVTYNFINNEVVVRINANKADSFRIKNNGYQWEPVSESIFLVKKLVLKVSIADVSFNAIFNKQYSALQLMKHEQSHE